MLKTSNFITTKKLKGRLWLGCWFDSAGLHVKVSLGKIHNPCPPPREKKTLLMYWLAHYMTATTISLWTAFSAKCKLHLMRIGHVIVITQRLKSCYGRYLMCSIRSVSAPIPMHVNVTLFRRNRGAPSRQNLSQAAFFSSPVYWDTCCVAAVVSLRGIERLCFCL